MNRIRLLVCKRILERFFRSKQQKSKKEWAFFSLPILFYFYEIDGERRQAA